MVARNETDGFVVGWKEDPALQSVFFCQVHQEAGLGRVSAIHPTNAAFGVARETCQWLLTLLQHPDWNAMTPQTADDA